MVQRILFIELLGGLGDVLIALPAIQALAVSHPQAALTVLTFAPGGDLLHHHPLITQVIQIPKGTARSAVEQILLQDYDLIVSDVTYEGIADLIQAHVQQRMQQNRKVQAVTNLWRNPPPDQQVSDRFLQILEETGLITAETADRHRQPQIYLTSSERAAAQAQLGAAYRPLICLYPDAGMAIKRASIEQWQSIAQALQPYQPTLIVPEGVDSQWVHSLIDQLSARSWPLGSLRQLAALLCHCDCMIAADTGPARIAAALGVPTITLFGPSWAGRYGQPAPHINLQGYPDCPERRIANFTEQSCWYSGECPFEWDSCVHLITPEVILDAIDRILSPTSDQAQKLARESHNRRSLFVTPRVPISISGTVIDRTPWQSTQNILVMRLDNIGDVLMTSPALRAIKQNRPEAKLTLMASPAGALAAPLLPWIDQVLPWRALWQDLGRLPFDPQREWELIHSLQARQFDAVIIFTSFKQSPHPAALIAHLAQIPLRLGQSQEASSALTHAVAPAPDDLHQVERNLRLIEAIGYRVSDRHLCLSIPASSQLPTTPYLLVNPWTSCQSRTYPIEQMAIAARELSTQTGWPVVVTGMEKDRDRATPLFEQLGERAIDRIGQTSLADLVALVDRAQLLLSNNTATMHIADATRTPSVILFAGTELESQWQPRQTSAILLRRPTTCSPCYSFTCPYQQECLEIAPDAVVEAGLKLLGLRGREKWERGREVG